MKSKMLAILATGLLAAPLAANAGFIYNGHEYEVVQEESSITWSDANAAAQATLGGGWHLATILDVAESNFIKSLLPTGASERAHFWLGAWDQGIETWAWVDGTPWTFTDWWDGEPNNDVSVNYLALDRRLSAWGWNDAPDDVDTFYNFQYTRGYVMERSVPEPGTLALLGLGLLGLGFARRRKHA